MSERAGPRIRLTSFLPDDAPSMCEGDRDPEHRRRFGLADDFVASIEHSRSVIGRWEEDRRAGRRFAYAVRDQSTGELLGGCELTPTRERTGRLSYWTYPPHRGRGVATRAIALLCDLGFGEMGLSRLEIVIEPDNVGSLHAAQRAGFEAAGERHGKLLLVRERGCSPTD